MLFNIDNDDSPVRSSGLFSLKTVVVLKCTTERWELWLNVGEGGTGLLLPSLRREGDGDGDRVSRNVGGLRFTEGDSRLGSDGLRPLRPTFKVKPSPLVGDKVGEPGGGVVGGRDDSGVMERV